MMRPKREYGGDASGNRGIVLWTIVMLAGIAVGGAIGYLLVAIYH